MNKKSIVRYLDQTDPVECPYGDVRRVITGGEGSANVHIVSVTKGEEHFHQGYDEVYYFLSGRGIIRLEDQSLPLRPGAVVYIPKGMVHSLVSETKEPLTFIIFGTPPMSIEDERARPLTPLEKQILDR